MKITFNELWGDYTNLSKEDIQEHAEEIIQYEYFDLVKNWNLKHNTAIEDAKQSYRQYKMEIKNKYSGSWLYLFYDKCGTIIYVGKTNRLLTRLTCEHFTKAGHLAQECYNKVAALKCVRINNKANQMVAERYLINKHKPQYNKQDMFDGEVYPIPWIDDLQWENWELLKPMTEQEYILHYFKENNLIAYQHSNKPKKQLTKTELKNMAQKVTQLYIGMYGMQIKDEERVGWYERLRPIARRILGLV